MSITLTTRTDMPKKIVFVSVGTSALKESLRSTRDHRNQIKWSGEEGLNDLVELLNTGDENHQDEAKVEYEHQKKCVAESLRNMKAKFKEKVERDEVDKYSILSSEVASLIAMERAKKTGEDGAVPPGSFTNEDQIHLLHSETADGKLCAEVTRDVLPDYIEIPQENIELVPIIGLRMDEPELFLDRGIPALLQAIEERAIANVPDYYLNITGGYKGAIPFLTVNAVALRRVKEFYLVYLFEKAPYVLIQPIDDMQGHLTGFVA